MIDGVYVRRGGESINLSMGWWYNKMDILKEYFLSVLIDLNYGEREVNDPESDQRKKKYV